MAKLSEEEKARRALARRHSAALQAEENAIRKERKRQEWVEKGTPLSWEEYQAGVSCRGCGLPVSDGTGSWPAPITMDRSQREEYEAQQEEFRRRHADCRDHTWTVQGSKTTYCGFCCPMPPMSEEQLNKVSDALRRLGRTDPSDLDMWRLTLTCDHVVERTQHRDHTYWSSKVANCPSCEQTRGIVTTEKLSQDQAGRDAARRQMSDELAKARSSHDNLQKKADTARQRVQNLERQLTTFDQLP